MNENRLQDMLRGTPHADIIAALTRLDLAKPEELDAYDRVIDRLGNLEPVHGEIASIVVNMVSEDDGQWANVTGTVPGHDGTFAIEFSPWGEWLPAFVMRGKDAAGLSDAEMLAYILWEMTWISDDPQEIAERQAEIFASVEKLKDELDATPSPPRGEA